MMARMSVGNPRSFDICSRVSRVTPMRMSAELSFVTTRPFFTRKMFSPDPSLTSPRWLRRIASSKPLRWASWTARTELMYWPHAFAVAGIAFDGYFRIDDTVIRTPWSAFARYFVVGNPAIATLTGHSFVHTESVAASKNAIGRR